MDARQFYTRVQQRAKLASVEEAREISRDVLSSMADVLAAPTAGDLMSQLPPELASILDVKRRGGPDELIDKEVFVGRLMNHVETEFTYDQTLGGLDLISVYSGDEVARRAQSVFAVLKETISPQTARAVESALPGEVAHWFRNAEPGVAGEGGAGGPPLEMERPEPGAAPALGPGEMEPRLKL